ncbi:hypothetical protein ASE01_20395 [Nocardioides sp. Root190]|nr:hypothetical protein ASE01_20395 [Nocardioides sp. Root190]
MPTSPAEIQFVFDQPVVPASSTITVTGPDANEVPLGEVASGHGGQTVTAPVGETLKTGEYVVEWFVTAADGDTMTGEFHFAVGSTAGLSLTPASSETGAAPTLVALRWLLFAGLALLLGGAVGARLARRTAAPGTGQDDQPQAWLTGGALVALIAAVGLVLNQIGGGSIVRGLSGESWSPLLDSPPGRIAGLEVGLLVLVLLALRLPTRWATQVVLLLACGVTAAEGFRAHPQADLAGWGAILVAVHLLAAAVWIGALVHVVRAAMWRRRRGLDARPLVAAYARMAIWLVVIVVTAGSLAGLRLVAPSEVLEVFRSTTYDRWMIFKLTLVLMALGLAMVARRRLRHRPQPSAAARLEVSVLLVVLLASAGLTASAPPNLGEGALPFPPPAVGQVVAVGGRAGWVGIGATASQGQLVVRLTTPRMDSTTEAQSETSYRLSANLTLPGAGRSAVLRFRRCGVGCFVAPVEWAPGTNTLTLDTGSERFAGGKVALTLPWPADSHPRLLRSARNAMLAVPRVDVHERVTSNTNAGLGDPAEFNMTGPDYVTVGPYGSGVAPIVIVIDRTAGETTLALAYPAEGTYVRLTLDDHDRIVREVLAAPHHLVTRTLIYPEAAEPHEH